MSLENNKIFAAVLTAGLAVMTVGYIGDALVHVDNKGERKMHLPIPDSAYSGASASNEVKKAAVLAPITPLLATADIAAGENIGYKKCASCHSFNSGEAHKLGPNLANVMGRTPGTEPGYAFSKVLTEMNGSWSAEELNKFLHKPKKYAKGTKMSFVGIKKEQDRANLIKWLSTLR